jgi:hypothetical protein
MSQKIYQIYNGRVHWRTPYRTLREAYSAHFDNHNLLFVRLPGDTSEGFLYDVKTGSVMPPVADPLESDDLDAVAVLQSRIVELERMIGSLAEIFTKPGA